MRIRPRCTPQACALPTATPRPSLLPRHHNSLNTAHALTAWPLWCGQGAAMFVALGTTATISGTTFSSTTASSTHVSDGVVHRAHVKAGNASAVLGERRITLPRMKRSNHAPTRTPNTHRLTPTHPHPPPSYTFAIACTWSPGWAVLVRLLVRLLVRPVGHDHGRWLRRWRW